MAKLTEKQKKFIAEYNISLNATQAALKAGYSKKTAAYIGAENLRKPQIQAEIQNRQRKVQQKLEVTQEKIIQELAAICFANGSDFAKVVPLVGGVTSVNVTPTDQVAPEKLAAIAGIEQTQSGVKVKTYDKVKALELLGKYLGLLDNNNKEQSAAAVKIICDIPKEDDNDTE